jgi:hypothetical protein
MESYLFLMNPRVRTAVAQVLYTYVCSMALKIISGKYGKSFLGHL